MGLTIHYTFRFKATMTKRETCSLASANTRSPCPFERVGNIVDLAGNACNYEHEDADPRDGWLLIQSDSPPTGIGIHSARRSTRPTPNSAALKISFAATSGSCNCSILLKRLEFWQK